MQQFNKSFVAYLLVVLLLSSIMTTSSFAQGAEEKYSKDFTGVEGLSNLQTTNEYDVIVGLRKLSNTQMEKTGILQCDISYITSNDAENELLYRSTLSVATLKEKYHYSETAIAAIKDYSGERLETNPDLRAAASTFTVGSDILLYGPNRLGMLFGWEWSSMPLLQLSDIVAATWDGTYTSGGNNNVALNNAMSFVNVQYTFTSTAVETFKLTTPEPYHNAKLKFDMMSPDSPYHWASEGAMFLYVDTVASSPSLEEVSFNFKYGHQAFAGSASVSFPYSIGINFSPVVSTMGSVTGRLKSNGTWIPYN